MALVALWYFSRSSAPLDTLAEQASNTPNVSPPYAKSPEPRQEPTPVLEHTEANAIIESTNVPITFWGKVVDSNGAPIDGAEVTFTYSTEHGNIAGAPWSDTKVGKGSTSSNVAGVFTIHDIRGSGLTIEDIRKAGYKFVRSAAKVFDYHGSTAEGRFKPDPNKPVRFVLISTATVDEIIFFGGVLGESILVPADGTPVRWSLVKGKAAPDGELQITFQRNPKVLTRVGERPSSWSAVIEVLGGGIIEGRMDDEVQTAPAAGYAQSVEYPQVEQKPGVGTRSFYIKTADGKYGRIQLELYVNDEGPAARCMIRGSLNPTGSRLVPDRATVPASR
jgi:hypothetical protein